VSVSQKTTSNAQADLAKLKRITFYSFGATEGLLLDRLNPRWKSEYFQRMFSTDSYFETGH
jgi:Na+-transporting NADH:ubiquinone oxidoreductase subunit NqrC